MSKSIIAIVLGFLAVSGVASAKGHRGGVKPIVCLDFTIVDDSKSGNGVFAVCHDGVKPRIFDDYSIVEMQASTDSEQDHGKLIKVLLAWSGR